MLTSHQIVTLALSLMLSLGRAQAQSPTALLASPKQITLEGAYARGRILLDSVSANGIRSDVTPKAIAQIADPKIVRFDDEGFLRPLREGKTRIAYRYTQAGKTLEAILPVTVKGLVQPPAPRFTTDIMPLLTKGACNSGPCHGANAGKGGFHLSLLGYDPESDYEALTRFAGARRIVPSFPEQSLLLKKAALQMRHGGGKRFSADSAEYRTLRDWIAKGINAPTSTEAQVTRLEVTPAVRWMKVGQSQRIRVEAHLSDGSRRDVSALVLFSSGDGSILNVTPQGDAKVVSAGEGAVVIRYGGAFATARLIAPFAAPRPVAKFGTNPIDKFVFTKIAGLGLEPSAQASDTEFLRRVTLDITGQLPSPDQIRTFVANREADKRTQVISSLLDSPYYIDFWTLKWSDLFRNSRKAMTDKGMYAFNLWIRQSVQENKSWAKMTQEILMAQGSAFTTGQANFFRAGIEPESQQLSPPPDLGETTAQLFLGVRMQCARCHNHPFEKWTQTQFYQMASFFGRLKAKPGDRTAEYVLFNGQDGEVYHPKSGAAMVATPLDGKPLPADFKGDRRQALAEWLIDRQNPFFARVMVNRLWKHFMGRGLVEPVDDMRLTNPATNDDLLNWLAKRFVETDFDIKALMRLIVTSQSYQLASQRTPINAKDSRYYSHFLVKRLSAEQMLDAVSTATNVPERFEGYPLGTRAAQLPDTEVNSYFLDAFGRPPRNTTCECERSNEPNVAQALHLLNSPNVNTKLTANTGRATTLARSKKTAEEIVEELYLTTVARFPTSAERERAVRRIAQAKDRQVALEDLLWALINSREFVFNH